MPQDTSCCCHTSEIANGPKEMIYGSERDAQLCIAVGFTDELLQLLQTCDHKGFNKC